MAKLGRASTPVDLLSYRPEDEQPSVFLLKESARQAILTVFNWTSSTHSHKLALAGLGLPPDHNFKVTNVLHSAPATPLSGGAIELTNEPPESVTMLKLIDTTVPESAPGASAQVPGSASIGEPVQVAAQAKSDDAPIVEYRWDFGDGTGAEGARASHTYTRSADYRVRLSVKGVDGLGTELEFPLKVTGSLRAFPDLSTNRREPGAVR
jgi:hypothetical protein